MSLLEDIQKKFRHGAYELSKHATDQAITRNIAVSEIEESVAAGEIIEHYPRDKYGPSCLMLGLTATGRPLHVQCGDPIRDRVKVITVYEPDESLWIDYRSRKHKLGG